MGYNMVMDNPAIDESYKRIFLNRLDTVDLHFPIIEKLQASHYKKQLEAENEELRREVKFLQDALEFQPGGEEYKKAKNHFDSCAGISVNVKIEDKETSNELQKEDPLRNDVLYYNVLRISN